MVLSGVLLSTISVVSTFVTIYLIDRMGRRPLLLVGTAGIAVSLLLCAYGFHQATYQVSKENIHQFEFFDAQKLLPLVDLAYDKDFAFKNAAKEVLGNTVYSKNDWSFLEAATTINANLFCFF